MKQKTGRKLLSILLTLAMVIGLMPGMGLTAYAAGTNVKIESEIATYKATVAASTTLPQDYSIQTLLSQFDWDVTVNSVSINSGSAQIKSGSGKDGTNTLTKDTDYTVTYTNNTNAGTATVTVTGMGD